MERLSKSSQWCLVGFVIASLLPVSAPGGTAKMEAGAFTAPKTVAGSGYYAVTFSKPFDVAPVVFVTPTTDGTDPVDLKIRNVTTTGFEVVMAEPKNLDGFHGAAMATSYFAMEPGVAVLPDGTVLEAGTISTSQTVGKSPPFTTAGGFQNVPFESLFGQAPALLAQIQTDNNETGIAAPPPMAPSDPWLAAAAKSLDANRVQLAMDRGEVTSPSTDVTVPSNETIGYVAITSRRHTPEDPHAFADDDGTDVVFDALVSADIIKGWSDNSSGYTVPFGQDFAAAPLVVANTVTRNGADGGWIRRGAVTAASVKLVVDEDMFLDGERNHAAEQAGVFAFTNGFHYTADTLPTASLRYFTSADTTADGTWQNVGGVAGFHWNINTNTRSTVSDTRVPAISRAYVFPNARGTMGTLEGLAGDPSKDSASFELWFRASDLTGDEILFETGGSGNGTSLAISGTDLLFTPSSATAATTKQLTAPGLTTLWTQLVGVIDMSGASGGGADPDLLFYVNGELVDTEFDVAGFADWAGGDGSGIGRINGSTGGDNTGLLAGFGNFSGEIAVFRFYESALTPEDIANLYRSVVAPVPEPATLLLAGLAGAGLAGYVRRRRKA